MSHGTGSGISLALPTAGNSIKKAVDLRGGRHRFPQASVGLQGACNTGRGALLMGA